MPRFRLGERVRFKAQAKKDYEGQRTIFVRDEQLPMYYDSWGSKGVPFNEGIIFGYRHVTNGVTIPGSPGGWTMDGYDGGESAEFQQEKGSTRKVWLVSYDLRRKPIMVFDEDVESIDGDRLPPYKHLPPIRLEDGTKVWPSDPTWGVRARSTLFPHMYVEQVVEAHSLKGALEAALEIPLVHWLQHEEEDS